MLADSLHAQFYKTSAETGENMNEVFLSFGTQILHQSTAQIEAEEPEEANDNA